MFALSKEINPRNFDYFSAEYIHELNKQAQIENSNRIPKSFQVMSNAGQKSFKICISLHIYVLFFMQNTLIICTLRVNNALQTPIAATSVLIVENN